MQIDFLDFVEYVYGFYGTGGLYAHELNGGRGFGVKAIYKACEQYKAGATAQEWGGGDSIDRERVRVLLEPSYRA